MITNCREDSEWVLDTTEMDAKTVELQQIIRSIQDDVAKRDLTKVYNNLLKIKEEISKEAVRCRGLNRTTGTIQDLEKRFTETEKTLRKLLTLAVLML